MEDFTDYHFILKNPTNDSILSTNQELKDSNRVLKVALVLLFGLTLAFLIIDHQNGDFEKKKGVRSKR
jgi:hypothetical protein